MARWINDPSNKMAAPDKPKRGKRHGLLIYRQLHDQLFWLSIVIIAIGVALLVWNPAELQRDYLLITVAALVLLLVLTFMFRLLAYVQCQTKGLLIRTPLQRLLVPYGDIRLARPTLLYQEFPPSEQGWNWRHFLDPLYGKSVIVIELEKLPRPAAWLKLWMGKYLVCPDVVGLALLVPDWMALRTEFDEYLAYHRRTKTQP